MLTIIIVPTLQRRNVVRDAPRHTFMTRRALKIGRRASRTAFLRWSVGTIISTAVPWIRYGIPMSNPISNSPYRAVSAE
ncbi:hypothetical protein CFN58_12680 [Pseudomonas avellanae]|uniref:DUF1534 domain-containing protein n=2 Tax=Pseudomonas syringae group TaxID=136849 RepID=A0A261WJJ4_9PSED|nr:hypothetical protein JN853_05975 [Pseudomonas syringae pv. actinidiae ICMP 9853]ATV19800.1 DUF1534 domain-containing protein [Pseudomonas syringae pv. actinidiae]OZI86319.1 hypothetical protein CFN58_12680 [Pseudomonas avellanae]NVL35804.1 DUF1534 domain-containing protein [Pseudomonas syringae pv. actinidiae]NVL39300.1 DUF1534 domain-containing protein [Pseudomonas syringae pv. actinidiae]